MAPLVEILGIISSILMTLVSIFFLYQVVYLYIPLIRVRKKQVEAKDTRYAVLIAARNEEMVLPHLLDSIKAQDYPSDLIDVFVVADNCTDNTAQVAQAHGAKVFQRFNKQFVGKGYAMHYLLEQIKNQIGWDKYDAFLIFDADNLLEPDYIRQLNRLPSEGYQAFCGYRNTKNFGTNWLTSGYGLWYLHESSHMNRSRTIIKTGCHVNGTGFGFTRQLLEQLGGWNFFTLTEDIEFNNYCASHGIKIGYCHDAVLYDEQPLTFGQSWKQRTRWAKGGMQVSFKYIGALLRNLFRFKWNSYTCFELMTLSFWGFGFATFSSALTLGVAALSSTPLGFLFVIGSTIVGAYTALAYVGLWTVILEWKRIRATTKEKIISVFTFPFFMMTFAPISICAMFSKVKWDPIVHTVAISSTELARK
ncbi:MAG: glycosyltransferase [Ruminococcaceae bacterium]|nr:glycosyltransferase [Oscillospiraceae bacterium]